MTVADCAQESRREPPWKINLLDCLIVRLLDCVQESRTWKINLRAAREPHVEDQAAARRHGAVGRGACAGEDGVHEADTLDCLIA
eukprot:5868723-Prymnesium_polylepis.1